ncbi:MAG: 16S rRNA (guanine(527)-N(7))-methyltransferase RsmG [Desulfobacteraceae bacterium]|nr:MAG: 16S rRNA (guanine(527)-N(7))-methyltransferase RsmG [Desulfobacteraceae bacterium]
MRIKTAEWRDLLRRQAAACDIGLTDKAVALLETFASELVAWNQKVNLTAIIDPAEVIEKHLIDSLMPSHHLMEDASILDIGTGGGLPGIPLKIHMPSLRVTMIDGSRKKISFVSYMIRQLGLFSAQARQVRAEELAEMALYQQVFDVVICRAVTSIEQFVTIGAPFLHKDGIMIAMKGPEFMGELDEFTAGAVTKDIRIIPYRLPVSDAARTLLLIRP